MGCTCPGTWTDKMKHWKVVHRGLPSFGYYRQTFSEVTCTKCCRSWSTKAAYVKTLLDREGV